MFGSSCAAGRAFGLSASALLHAAILAACLGRNDESIALLQRAVTLDPLSVPAQRLLGQRC